jgi:glycosyltransferase involved in cell wall biosynthesis
MRGPRLALVIQTTEGFGGEKVFREIVCALQRTSAVSLLVITLERQSARPSLPHEVEYIPLAREGNGLLAFAKISIALSSALRRQRVDGVIGFMTYANLVCAAASILSLRRVITVLSEHTQLSRALDAERNARGMRRMVRALYPRVHAILAVSEAAKKDLLLEVHSAPPVHVVGNPIAVGAVVSASHEALIKWPENSWTSSHLVSCIASFGPAKGHEVLIHAFGKLGERYRLALVGDGPRRKELEVLVEGLGLNTRISFLGFLPNPQPIVRASCTTVLPSRWEGFGLAAVESAILGVPVVASNVGGLRELIPAYVRGILVPPGDPDELARAIQEAAIWPNQPPSNPELRFGDFAPGFVAAKYLKAVFGDLLPVPMNKESPEI